MAKVKDLPCYYYLFLIYHEFVLFKTESEGRAPSDAKANLIFLLLRFEQLKNSVDFLLDPFQGLRHLLPPISS